MRIEAHLERHYPDRHNELVLGKVLTASRRRREYVVTRTQGRGKVVEPNDLPHRELVQQIEAMFTATWFNSRSNLMVRVIESALEDKPGHPKPRTLVCAAVPATGRSVTLPIGQVAWSELHVTRDRCGGVATNRHK
jgi:hypothetical protein